MAEYPRDLLIPEDVIREFEEQVGVRFINKTESAKALKKHDAKIKADAVSEFIDYCDENFAVFMEEYDAKIKATAFDEFVEEYKEWFRLIDERDAKVIADFVEGYKEWFKTSGEYCSAIENCNSWCIECYAKQLKENK